MLRCQALALTLSMTLTPLAALACDPAGPENMEQGSSVSVGRMADLIWSATVVDGRPVDALNEDLWIKATPDGGLMGRAGCNTFAGHVDLDAGVFAVTDLAVTERACAAAVMENEAAFLKALSESEAFIVAPTGPLYLLRGDRSVAMCFG